MMNNRESLLHLLQKAFYFQHNLRYWNIYFPEVPGEEEVRFFVLAEDSKKDSST
jgi:hypothetical protein